MGTINDNGINFNLPNDVKRGVKGNIQNLNNNFGKSTSANDIDFFVNAVEIDWNGVQIGES